MVVSFFSGFVLSANATTLNWNSDSGSAGLISSFAIPADVVFTEWNKTITLSGSDYTFVLGDSSHAPTQGVAAQTFGRSDTFQLTDNYGGWHWSQTALDLVSIGPTVHVDFFNFDYPSGMVPVSQPQPVGLYDALVHFYDGSIIYFYSDHYLHTIPWGDHTLTMPSGHGGAEDWGRWNITGLTLPKEDPKPTGYGTPTVTPNNPIAFHFLLGQTFFFDYYWKMGINPPPYQPGYQFDVLALQAGEGWQFIGQIDAYGNSTGWQRALFQVPDNLQGQEVDVRFVLTDYDPTTDPIVFLDHINSLPEPYIFLLLGSGFVGLVGFRRKFRR